jgi:tetratricopeptide (TPR) repeat protein
MKRSVLIAAVMIFALAAAPALRAEPESAWQPHYEAALEQAKAGGRDIFIVFTGSDWCRPGAVFKAKVLASPVFRSAAAGRFVLLEIDHPSVMSDARKELEKKNAKFKLWIANYPTVVLADSAGRVYGRLACAKETDPAAFLQKLAKLTEAKAARDREWELAEKCEGEEKAMHLGKGLDALEETLARQPDYNPIRDMIKKADPQDKTGYLARYQFSLNPIMEKTVWRLADEKKFEEAENQVAKLLANPRLTLLQRQELTAAQFALWQRWGKKEEALGALRKIIGIDPKSDMAAGAQGYLDYLQSAPVAVTDRWDGTVCGDPAVWVRDVTRTITRPGRYKISFEQKAGGDRLTIKEVVLLAGERELAADKHEGRADNSSGCYLLEVPELPAGATLTLRMTIRCGGWRNSNGKISVVRVEGTDR